MTGAPPLLDAEHADFILGGVSIIVAARGAGNMPDLVRALGCRLSSDRRRLAVLLPASSAGAVLGDVRANGAVAVVFSQPSTHRTLQLKGRDAYIAAPDPGDRSLMREYRAALTAQIVQLGFPAAIAHALLDYSAAEAVAVEFTPEAVFQQTPGPAAGAILKATHG